MAGSTTGSSVIAIAFDGGVMVATDTLVSYGSMARFTNCKRFSVINKNTMIAASGDYADYQYLERMIRQKQIAEKQWNDGIELLPKALHSWITRAAYKKRSQFKPLWCTWIVAGMQPNEETDKLEPFLGYVDKLGTAFKSNVIATGFGQYLATPLLREIAERQDRLPSEAEAREVLTKCMEVLYYRDARSYPKYHLVVVKADGAHQEGPIELKGDWQIAHYVKAY